MTLKTFHQIFLLLVTLLCTSCWYGGGDDDGLQNVCMNDSLNGSINATQLFIIEPERNFHFSFITLTASISIPNTNTFFGDEVDLLQESSLSEVTLGDFNHKDITLGNEITVLEGRLEEDGSAILIYSELSDSYELRFEILLERLGEYTIRNHRDLSLVFNTIENCAFTINTSSQRGFGVQQ